MITQLIKANPDFRRDVSSPDCLDVSEFFFDTIQGEGINIGHPAAFLRLQHCSLDCQWCDTQEVWRYGNPYTFDELINLMSKSILIDRLCTGQHLVVTGGSPLKQQYNLAKFFQKFGDHFGFLPYVEIENECTRMPINTFYVKCWNNSPKLSSSGNKRALRYKPEILTHLNKLENSWFKFVVSDETDWQEILMDFIEPCLIDKDKIILMPLGETRAELERNRPIALEMAIKHGVRFTDRLHITIWDKKTGV